MVSKEEIQEMSKNWNLSEKDAEQLLDDVCKPSLDNTHCSFDEDSGIGVGASDQPIKRDL